MASDHQLIDMAALRSKLLAMQLELADLADGGLTVPRLRELLEQAIAMLNPRLDADARHPSVDPNVVTNAMRAAHDALIAGGLQNPVELLIVQTHDDAGKTTGRTLGTSAANPQDLLRLCLRNVEREIQRRR